MTDCYFFGYRRSSGHVLQAPVGQFVASAQDRRVCTFKGDRHLDGSLAPRLHHRTKAIVCGAQEERRSDLEYASSECPQGQYLRHVLDNGFTAIQWWDRTQGDQRGACNSTILLRGEHTSEEVLTAGRANFPHVFAALEAAGVKLVEVFLEPKTP